MSHPSRTESLQSTPSTWRSGPIAPDPDLPWPFGKVEAVDADDIRETAYEIFFVACRSSPGFGGSRAALSYRSAPAHHDSSGNGAGSSGSVKRALGLKPAARHKRAATTAAAGGGAGTIGRRRMTTTTSERMRQQMRMTEQSESRLRKTLMRAIVGQVRLLFPFTHVHVKLAARVTSWSRLSM
ncbi:hypothetical protein ACLOJK_007885 [Asimina triloba]